MSATPEYNGSLEEPRPMLDIPNLMEVTDPQDLINDILARMQGVKEYEKIPKAIKIASIAHEGQVRKEGKPYIIHPLRVAYRFITYVQENKNLSLSADGVAIALLHDILEDTDVMTPREIGLHFGDAVQNGVVALTKYNHATKEYLHGDISAYFLQLANQPEIIRTIKVHDRIDNLESIQFLNPSKKRQQIAETHRYVCPLADGNVRLAAKLQTALRRAITPRRAA